jgi:hypothetical protein
MHEVGHTTWQLILRATLAAGVVSCIGCYDSSVLVERMHSNATRSQSHEIDLGTYRTTMPRDRDTNAFVEMELRMFGTAPQYRIAAIKKQLKADGYLLRAATIAAMRETSPQELAEPDLSHLRERLTQVANHVLTDAPLQSIGFEHVRIVD